MNPSLAKKSTPTDTRNKPGSNPEAAPSRSTPVAPENPPARFVGFESCGTLASGLDAAVDAGGDAGSGV
jgi:hypothetical protein